MPNIDANGLRSRSADVSDGIYDELLRRIICFELQPGARIRERDVVEQFPGSRTPAREALQRLEREGFLVADASAPRRRLRRVASLPWTDIGELWQLISLLEGMAVDRACALPAAERADLVHRLSAINARLRGTRSEPLAGSRHAFSLQRAWHITWVEAGSGPRLIAFYAWVRPHIERYEWLYWQSDAADLESSCTEHDVIADAIGRGDAEVARNAVANHWRAAGRRSREVLGGDPDPA